MYYVVHQQNASEQYVDKVITDSASAWGFNGAFLRCKGLESLAGRRELSRHNLAGIVRHAKGVFVSVFDAESFLIWDIAGSAYI